MKREHMKTLVIHPKDETTNFLSVIYQDKDWTVITEHCTKRDLQKQIEQHDRIVMLGHGTAYGLIGNGGKELIIDSSTSSFLKDKLTVCIWYNADIYFKAYQLQGFYTGMIISEIDEAYFCLVETTYEEIEASNTLFSNTIKNAIDSEEMLKECQDNYQGDSEVIAYNHTNMYENMYKINRPKGCENE